MLNTPVVIVDDDLAVADFVAEVTRQSGFQSRHFLDGREFLDIADHRQVKILILDLMMPEIDGIEMIRYVADKMPHISLILMSGIDASILHAAQELAVEHGLKLLGVLQKPFHPDRLSKLLLDWKKDHEAGGIQGSRFSDSEISESELREALVNKQLKPYYQPQVSLNNHQVLGFEVLLRWQHPSRGLLAPMQFIPLAEQTGLIKEISLQLIEQVARQWSQFNFIYTVSVNMSAAVFSLLDLPEQLEIVFKKYHLDPSQLILEITETAIMEELVKSLDCLTRLRMKGFQLSIDDFGTGYSSLVQLHQLPVSEIKIDMQFIKKMEYDKEALAIVETVILLAKKLGHNVVAEGVETRKIYQRLIELGADIAQGYYLARPMPAEEIENWIQHWQNMMDSE